ncbi:MAG: AMP-binding protein [Pirellulales bacterium]
MELSTSNERRRLEALDRAAIEGHQLARLNELLAAVLPQNEFYAAKLGRGPLKLASLTELAELPFTTKQDLVTSGAGEGAGNRTFPLERYIRFHQTSGTSGRPLPVYDTADDWRWWVNCWQYVLDAAAITADDRALLAFSFGPFIGFWSAFDALVDRGTLVIPGGGMSSLARLDLIKRTGATALFCTPTYALRLVEVAGEHQIDLKALSVRKIIVAGEPGGSLPAVRERIERAWQARVTDHAGATEIGPWGYGSVAGTGLHILETEFIAEFLAVDSNSPAEGGVAELVLTPLGRIGSPVIRYRTGDLVRPMRSSDGFVILDGGVLGRVDDMLVIRGVNVFPTSVEQILRSFAEVAEYRLTVRKRGAMDELLVEVEDQMQQPDRIAAELQLRLGLTIDVRLAPAMSLPRFDGKGRRFVDERG